MMSDFCHRISLSMSPKRLQVKTDVFRGIIKFFVGRLENQIEIDCEAA